MTLLNDAVVYCDVPFAKALIDAGAQLNVATSVYNNFSATATKTSSPSNKNLRLALLFHKNKKSIYQQNDFQDLCEACTLTKLPSIPTELNLNLYSMSNLPLLGHCQSEEQLEYFVGNGLRIKTVDVELCNAKKAVHASVQGWLCNHGYGSSLQGCSKQHREYLRKIRFLAMRRFSKLPKDLVYYIVDML